MYVSYAVTALHVLGGILLLLGVLRVSAKVDGVVTFSYS